MNEAGPSSPRFESPLFETGHLVTCRITESKEFIEIIGSAYADSCSGFGEDAKALIKTASQFLIGKQFKVLQYFPADPGEVHRISVVLNDTSLTADNLYTNPEAARLNEEFEQTYNTGGSGILFFLQTNHITVGAVEFQKAGQATF